MSSVCILPTIKLKNLISKTEAAPKEHHDRGMSGRVVGEESGGFVSKVEVRTQALTMFVFNHRPQKWDWAKHTGIYLYIHI